MIDLFVQYNVVEQLLQNIAAGIEGTKIHFYHGFGTVLDCLFTNNFINVQNSKEIHVSYCLFQTNISNNLSGTSVASGGF